MTSIHAGKIHPQFGSSASIGASRLSIVTDAAPDLLLDEIEEVEGNNQPVVRFEMEREDGMVDNIL